MKNTNNQKEIYLAYAGGASSGGMYGAGVGCEINKHSNVVSVSGESAGAINALLNVMGKMNEAFEYWMRALEKAPQVAHLNPFKKSFYNNLKNNHSFFDVQKYIFAGIDDIFSLQEFQDSPIRGRFIYTKVHGQGISDGDKVGRSEKLIHPFLFVPYVVDELSEKYQDQGAITRLIKHIKNYFDQRLVFTKALVDSHDLSNGLGIEEMRQDIVRAIQASCCLPPFHGLPVKKDAHLLIDGGFTDELGGVEYLLEEAKANPSAVVALITRYPQGHRKHIRRKDNFERLCKQFDFPSANSFFIAPNSELPLASNYSNNLDQLKDCFMIGEEDGKQFVKQIL